MPRALQAQLPGRGRVLPVARFSVHPETVRFWEERFLPHFTEQVKAKRKGKAGRIWLIDETFLKVHGQWCYLYRGIDEDGNLVDVRLSKTRE
ncbi:MAG: DDE-type integrase/transposase/recombinase [Phormidesmis sp.]